MRRIIFCLAIGLPGSLVFGLLGFRSETRQVHIVVDGSGHGDFRTILEAVNSLPVDAGGPRVIFVRRGLYHVKVVIEKNNVILPG